MRFGHFNELHRYNERRQAERMDAIIAKCCAVALILLLAVQVWGNLA